VRETVVAPIVFTLLLLLLGLALYGCTRTAEEGDKGVAWCYENGGQVVGHEGGSQPICIKDNKRVELPLDKNGIWPEGDLP